MKKELIWCRKCGKYAIKPCQLTSEEVCPSCGSLNLYDIVADPAAENYFNGDDDQIYSIDDLKLDYEKYKNEIDRDFCISTFAECLEIMTDMGGTLWHASFDGEF